MKRVASSTSTDKFKKELYEKVRDYFEGSNRSKLANGQMWAKLIIAAVWWLGSLALVYTSTSTLSFVLFYGLHLLSHAFILLNIAHDANHFAIVENKFFGRVLRYSFDLCGISSYVWRQLHNVQHHNNMNVNKEDDGLATRGILRYTPFAKRLKIHRFQHLYVFLAYALFSIDYILFKDFESLFFPFLDGLKGKKHSKITILKIVAFKIFYISYTLIIPIFVLGFAPTLVLLSFVCWQLIVGMIGATVIQVSHQSRSNEYPASTHDYEDFVYHVFATTVDHSYNSSIADWCFGGLHLHVLHHLVPRICHTHYRELTANVIEPVAKKHNISYRTKKTFFEAIREHYLHLRNLGLKTA
ncbi:MAG: fatty acid desaturase [Ekhidna sp.]|nr:fatty acid desaturase [Ekhidna sp.]